MDNFLLNLLPTLATVFLTLCYLPQIVKTFKTKDVSSMSLPFWILLNLALTCLLVNAFIIMVKFGTWGYFVTEVLNEGLAFIMLMMVLKYRRKR